MSVLNLVGELSIGAICPLVVGATATVVAELQAKLTGCLQLSAQLSVTPPTLSANLSAAAEMLASLTLAVNVSLPGIDFQVAAVAELIGQIQGALGILIQLQTILGADLFVYTYLGAASAFGPAVSSAVGGGWPDGSPAASEAEAIVLVAVEPAARVAMGTFFAGAV